VLKFENMNPRKDPGGDIYLEPMNMMPDPADPKSPKPELPPMAESAESLTADEEDAAEEAERSATFAPIFQDAGERVARKEREAVERFAKQADTVAKFVAKVNEFYRTYEKTVERVLRPPLALTLTRVWSRARRRRLRLALADTSRPLAAIFGTSSKGPRTRGPTFLT
jgi:hypothetical protein